MTSFVGRERELELVVDALGHSRIVTLIGVGGIGKTRLAVQAAAEVVSGYADGAWFCALAGVSDRGAVSEAVGVCLGVRRQRGESPMTTLVSFLRRKQLLLVLDNCEHVIDAAGSLTEALVRGCPGVTVLATSREALAVEGEVLRPLRSLAVPDESATTVEAAGVAAVQLFADRARAVRPEFALDDTTTPVVADICRQLDGMPLAIELASARVGALTVGEIARRLDQRFRLLTGGRRTALERHQTLRGTVDWSYELLDELEARVFNRSAAFAGGFVLEAAEEVVSGDGIDADDVLDLLSGLVARSMVDADEADGGTRYRLHETMRQYGRERLELRAKRTRCGDATPSTSSASPRRRGQRPSGPTKTSGSGASSPSLRTSGRRLTGPSRSGKPTSRSASVSRSADSPFPAPTTASPVGSRRHSTCPRLADIGSGPTRRPGWPTVKCCSRTTPHTYRARPSDG